MAHSLATHGVCTCGHLAEFHELISPLLASSAGFDWHGACEALGCNCDNLDLNDTQICKVCDPEEADD